MSKLPPGVNPNIAQIPPPVADPRSLALVAQSLKQAVDSLAGFRGGRLDRAVTFADLVSLGLVTSQVVQTQGTVSAAVGSVEIPSGYLLANVSSTENLPVGVSLSSLLDVDISSAEGTAIQRTATGWGALAIGEAGQVVVSSGSLMEWGSLLAPTEGLTIALVGSSLQFNFNDDLGALEGLTDQGLAVRTGESSWVTRQITGSPGSIQVQYGDGVNGDPVVSIASGYPGQTSITTVGTITHGAWHGTAIATLYGGTGQTTYTDGQLLVGNTSTGGLNRATLTAGANITITNGHGSIVIAGSSFALATSLKGL